MYFFLSWRRPVATQLRKKTGFLVPTGPPTGTGRCISSLVGARPVATNYGRKRGFWYQLVTQPAQGDAFLPYFRRSLWYQAVN